MFSVFKQRPGRIHKHHLDGVRWNGLADDSCSEPYEQNRYSSGRVLDLRFSMIDGSKRTMG